MGHNDIMEDPFLPQFKEAVTRFLHGLGLPTRRGSKTRALIPDFDGLVRTTSLTGKQVIERMTHQQKEDHMSAMGGILRSVTDERNHISDEECLDPDIVYAQVFVKLDSPLP